MANHEIVVQHAPQFTPEQAASIALRLYGIEGLATALPSERDQNFRIDTAREVAGVLKIANATEREETLDLQNAALAHLAAAGLATPRVLRGLSGAATGSVVAAGGTRHLVRMVTWVPGRPLAALRLQPRELLESLGRRLGEMDAALSGFTHAAMARPLPWDLATTPWIRAELGRFDDEGRRALVERVLERFEQHARPRLSSLRRQVIHNDWNDHNVIVGRADGPAEAGPHEDAGPREDARTWDPALAGLDVVTAVDFGDLLESWTVADLAVGCAYAMLDKPDPVAAAAAIVRGYHQALPLAENELEVLLDLIRARLAISVTMAACQSAKAPRNDYLRISEAAAWKLLAALDATDPAWALCSFRHACGLAPSRTSPAVRAWIAEHRGDFAQAFDVDLGTAPLAFLDLGIGSLDIPSPDAVQQVERFCAHVNERLRATGAHAAIGRYDEARLIYTTDLFRHASNWEEENRTVHLGVDVFLPAGTEVRAPLGGVVRSARNNAGEGDYGPTVVIEHEVMNPAEAGSHEGGGRGPAKAGPHEDDGRGPAKAGPHEDDGRGPAKAGPHEDDGRGPAKAGPHEDDGRGPAEAGPHENVGRGGASGTWDPASAGLRFYTLFGHLSLDSLTWTPGQRVSKGDVIGRLGDPSVNGGWPPHLHFQVITDLLGRDGEFPGVAAPGEREIWLSLCPDPGVMLGLPADRGPARPPAAGEILAARRRHLGRNLSLSYRRPLTIVRGYMQHLFDADGRRFLDAVNNVPHVGHNHPRVVEAVARQLAVLNTNTRYLNPVLTSYAERLASLMPDPLDVCFVLNSGSEANELALRLARAFTRGTDLVVLESAYHGNTTSLVEMSPYKFNGPGGAGRPAHVRVAMLPDAYRGPYAGDDARAGAKYAAHVGEALAAIEAAGRRAAAFFCESLPSCAGQIVLPQGYLAEAYRLVRERGGVAVADEVQVGFGRVGSHLWGFETQGVVPDIVTLGKPIGNGFPLAAVVTRREIADAFDNGMEYFNTFGGSQAACAAGHAVLDVMRDERLQARALEVGGRLAAGLARLKDRFPAVGDVRGLGLFLGVELVSDRGTREPAAALADAVVNRMRDRGILLSTDGPLHNVLKIKPPLQFSAADADRTAATLAETLEEIAT